MDSFWANFAIEIALLSLLGTMYYFWQKRKILRYEENKEPIVMGQILQSCLVVRGDDPNPKLDPLIESLDDYLQSKAAHPPTALLKVYADSPDCDPELKMIILEGLKEIARQ